MSDHNLTEIIQLAVDAWWGSNDPRPTMEQAIAFAVVAQPEVALGALVTAHGYSGVMDVLIQMFKKEA